MIPLGGWGLAGGREAPSPLWKYRKLGVLQDPYKLQLLT